MLELLCAKKAKNEEIISFMQRYKSCAIFDLSYVEIENWMRVRKEAHKRKIGPYVNNVAEANSWTS